ncbi:MAG TPA: sugar transferase [Planctomycetota bacterium]|nr:sugar transferase [Planctomycetota bacterium]
MQPFRDPNQSSGTRAALAAVPNFVSKPSSRGLDAALMVVCLVPGVVLVAGIAIVNGLVFRDLRRVFFFQERMGWRGRVFTLVKFRTMRDAVDREGHALNDEQRVTRLGRLLRNTHLDELPQLWNILHGDMSFLGPRPEMLSAHEWAVAQIPGFEQRLAIRPGITGLAQITQGYAQVELASYQRKLAIDLEYIRRKGWLLDAKILVGTAIWMLRGKGWRWNVPALSELAGAGEGERLSDTQGPRKAA